MEVTQAKWLDYLIQLHSAVITGLVAGDTTSTGMNRLMENIEENRLAFVLNALLDEILETEEAVTAINERHELLNGENRL